MVVNIRDGFILTCDLILTQKGEVSVRRPNISVLQVFDITSLLEMFE